MSIKTAYCPSGTDLPVTFLKPPTSANSRNEVLQTTDTDEWDVVANAYGEVETGTGREVWKARHQYPETNCVIKCSWNATLDKLTTRNAARLNGKSYQILAVINTDEANQQLKFFCRREAEK